MKDLKKLAVPLAVFLALGFLVTVFPGCSNPAISTTEPPPGETIVDEDSNGSSSTTRDPPPPFRPVHPEQPRVPGNVTVDIFNFNDFHGALDNNVSDSDPGAARFAAVTRHLMRNSEHSILLAGGDNYIGQPISDIFYGRPTSRIFRELGVSYSVVGNHEWDWGFDKFEQFVYYGHLHFLAANIFYEGTNTRPDIFHPYVVINRAGRRIAIVGFTLVSTPRVVVASAIAGFEFRDVQPWLGDMVNRLRDYYGAEAVLALTHENNARILGDLANLGFDAIFSAHSHTIMNTPINGVPVVRTSHNGRSLARVSLDFGSEGLTGVRTHIYQDFVDGHLPANVVDQNVAAIVTQYDRMTAPFLDVILGQFGSGIYHGRHPWANQLVFDYVTRVRPDWEDVVLIQNNGGWRDIGHQEPNSFLTVRHVWTLMPFINEIYLFRLRGQYLIHLLNGRNATNTDNAAPSGTVNAARNADGNWTVASTGQVITPSGLYKVSMNDFMFTGGDLFGVEELVDDPYPIVLGTTLRDAILAQVRHSPPQILPERGLLAAWNFPGNPAVNNALNWPDNNAVRPSSGYQRDSARLQFLTQSGSATTPRVLSGMSAAVNVRNAADDGASGLNGLANNAWWQTAISTVGHENIEVSWRMRSTNAGPRDWRMQYRAGSYGYWRNLGGAIAVVTHGGVNPSIGDNPLNYRFLPPTAENQERLYLRWLMTSNVSASGGTVGAGGTHQINNIRIRIDAEPFYNCDHCNDAGCDICNPPPPPPPPPPPAPISISAANAIPSAPIATAEVATVEGFVVGRAMQLSGQAYDTSQFFVQDGTGPRDGILVFGANLSSYVGRWVRATGYVTPASQTGPRNQIQVGGAAAVRGAVALIDPQPPPPEFGTQAVELSDIVAPNNEYWFMPVSLGPVQFGHNADRLTFLAASGVNTAAAPPRSHFVIVEGGQRLELRPPVEASATSPWEDFATGEYIMITRAYAVWQNARLTIQLLHAQVERVNP